MQKEMKIKFIILSTLVSSCCLAQNILPNSSFEQWFDTLSVQMPVGWVTSNFMYHGSATKDSTKHTGSYGVKLHNDSSIAFIGTVARVESGRNYSFSGWVKCPSFMGGAFVLSWRDSLGYGVGDSILIPVFLSLNYTLKDTILVPDSAAAFIAVGFSTIPLATVYLDDITLDSLPRAIEEDLKIKNQFILDKVKLEILQNPFFNNIVINYSLVVDCNLQLIIYNISGRTINTLINEEKPAGSYTIPLETRDLSAGIYFAKLKFNNSSSITKKLLLIK